MTFFFRNTRQYPQTPAFMSLLSHDPIIYSPPIFMGVRWCCNTFVLFIVPYRKLVCSQDGIFCSLAW